MTINIPQDLQEFVGKLVESGRFESPSAVITAALISLEQQESMADLPEGALEAMYPGIGEMLAEGLAALEAGDISDGEEFFDELERELMRDDSQDRKTA